jgi:tryptophanyl-tRNA synthetase
VDKEKIAAVKNNIRELVLDNLSVGVDPKKAIIYQQSQIPEVTDLFTICSMLISVPRLQRVLTLKEVMRDLKLETASLGLLSYPVLQAADILMVKAHLVPVGRDQASHLEITREIAERFNSLYGQTLPIPETLIGEVPTLPGTDGKAKMSKSLGNGIQFADDPKTIEEKVMQMYTDPDHIHVEQPGKVAGNIVFEYLDIFDTEAAKLAELKEQYKQGGLGDVVIKKRLISILQEVIAPIREQREYLAKNPDHVMDILKAGTKQAREVAAKTLSEVKKAMKIDYF